MAPELTGIGRLCPLLVPIELPVTLIAFMCIIFKSITKKPLLDFSFSVLRNTLVPRHPLLIFRNAKLLLFARASVCKFLRLRGWIWTEFLPARRYASAGYRDRNVSVRLSVCLSVTRRYCVKTKKASLMISSPSGSPKTLVF